MNELTKIIEILGGDHGVTAQFLALVGALRIPLKTISGTISAKLTEALVKVANSTEKDDDEIVEVILMSRPYRWIAFLLDWICSIKLPTMDDFTRLIEQQNQPK